MPSIISTASSLTEKPDRRKTSRTSFKRFSASAGNNNLRPAVALRTNGVFDHNSFGTNSFAFSNSDLIDAAPYCFHIKI